MSLSSLPSVSDEAIRQMNKLAEQKFGAEVNQDISEQQSEILGKEASEEQQEEQNAGADIESPQLLTSAPAPQSVQESSKESNLRILRERVEKAEREKDEILRMLKDQYNPKYQQQQATTPQTEEDLNFSMAPDELAEGKHLAKLNKKIERLEQQLAKNQQQSTAMSVETKLKYQYPDFEKVVSASNVASLSEMYPEIAKTIGESSDLYSKAVSAYTMIKKFGIHVDDAFVQEKTRVQTNAAKPRPLASLSPQQGDSPLSKANAFANGLTPELSKQLWKETQDAMKNG